MTPKLRRALIAASVVCVGIVFALAFGEQYGARNQQTYLTDVLVRAVPGIYRNDWFVTQTHHHHVLFAYVAAPLFSIDPEGARAFGVAQVLAMVATFAGIYGLVAVATPRARLVVFVGIVGLVALGGGRSLGGSYLYAGYLQPSSLATLGWLLAANAWIRNRLWLAGIALAIGAAFHINYALLGIGAFALCELAWHRKLDWRRLLVLLGPSLVVVAVFLPTLIASSRGSHGKEALDILIRFIFPNHFRPSRVRIELFSLAGWHLIAIAMKPVGDDERRTRLFWFAMSVMASCIVATVLVQIPPFISLTRLFVWRIAPFGVLVAQILLFVGIGEFVRGERPMPRGWQLVGLLLGASLVIYNAFTRPREPYPEVITAVMLAGAAVIALRRQWLGMIACAALCMFALWHARERLMHPILFQDFDTGMIRWARVESPRDAVFLAPPYYGDMRLLARRAIVVDDKSPPMYMDELVTWYDRLGDSVDGKKLVSLEDAWTRWDALSAERLVAIAKHFDADYIVLDKGRSKARPTLPIAYEDDGNVVYRAR